MLSTKQIAAAAALALAGAAAPAATAQAPVPAALSSGVTYADLADLADSAKLVVRAQVRKLTRVEAERARGLRPGFARYYIEARTRALLTGAAPQGQAVTYLVDLRLDARGKPPPIKKQDVLLFARPVAGRPGEIQLVAPDAQVVWSPAVEARLRTILMDLLAPDAPGRVTGVRELINVPGTLSGESETQIFLTTSDGSAASITVAHKPGAPAAWGVSFSELLAVVGQPPRHDTLPWYRLACYLPNRLPPGANLSETAGSRVQAENDYRMVLGDLGVCSRTAR